MPSCYSSSLPIAFPPVFMFLTVSIRPSSASSCSSYCFFFRSWSCFASICFMLYFCSAYITHKILFELAGRCLANLLWLSFRSRSHKLSSNFLSNRAVFRIVLILYPHLCSKFRNLLERPCMNLPSFLAC